MNLLNPGFAACNAGDEPPIASDIMQPIAMYAPAAIPMRIIAEIDLSAFEAPRSTAASNTPAGGDNVATAPVGAGAATTGAGAAAPLAFAGMGEIETALRLDIDGRPGEEEEERDDEKSLLRIKVERRTERGVERRALTVTAAPGRPEWVNGTIGAKAAKTMMDRTKRKG